MIKRLIPTLNRVLIKKLEVEAKTASGIILQNSEKVNQLGVVVEVGPGEINPQGNVVPLQVKVGDSVLLPEYGGQKVVVAGNELYLYRDTDVLGVVHK